VVAGGPLLALRGVTCGYGGGDVLRQLDLEPSATSRSSARSTSPPP